MSHVITFTCGLFFGAWLAGAVYDAIDRKRRIRDILQVKNAVDEMFCEVEDISDAALRTQRRIPAEPSIN